MWESRICNPINNITDNTIYISTHISIYIFTYISTNIPVSIHPQTGFLLRGGEKNHVFCVSLQSQRRRVGYGRCGWRPSRHTRGWKSE